MIENNITVVFFGVRLDKRGLDRYAALSHCIFSKSHRTGISLNIYSSKCFCYISDAVSTGDVAPVQPVVIVSGIVDEDSVEEQPHQQQQKSWSEKVVTGIDVGSQWISWGLLKGAEYTGVLIEKVRIFIKNSSKIIHHRPSSIIVHHHHHHHRPSSIVHQ